MKKTYRDYLFVGLQFSLFALLMVEPRWFPFQLPSWAWYPGIAFLITGLCTCGLALLQLNQYLSPFPTPLANTQLITNGVYGLARHPIYTGVLLAAIGLAGWSGSGWRLLIAAALFVLFYFKSSYEEAQLERVFPNYGAYRQRVGRFLPRLVR